MKGVSIRYILVYTLRARGLIKFMLFCSKCCWKLHFVHFTKGFPKEIPLKRGQQGKDKARPYLYIFCNFEQVLLILKPGGLAPRPPIFPGCYFESLKEHRSSHIWSWFAVKILGNEYRLCCNMAQQTKCQFYRNVVPDCNLVDLHREIQVISRLKTASLGKHKASVKCCNCQQEMKLNEDYRRQISMIAWSEPILNQIENTRTNKKLHSIKGRSQGFW